MAPDGYECVPPEDVRAELRGRGRPSSPEAKVDTPPTPPPVKPSSPVKAPSDWRGFLILAGIVLASAVVMLSWPQPVTPVTPAPVSTPKAAATPKTVTTSPIVEVRRAELVPVPRAQLVHVRQIGSVENDLMPDGRILTTRYMGELFDASSLPTRGAELGDMWFTRRDGHCWVLAPIGAGSATVGWIDP